MSPSASATAVDSDLLAEAQRQIERYIDSQVHAQEELDDKLEHLMTLATALFGGGIALAAYFAGITASAGEAPSRALLGLIGGGAALNLVSILLLLHGYVGLPFLEKPAVQTGPDPAWVAGTVGEVGWTGAHLRHSVIKSGTAIVLANETELRRTARLRQRAAVLGLFALGLYSAATFMWWQG